jgi:hypothetical protein
MRRKTRRGAGGAVAACSSCKRRGRAHGPVRPVLRGCGARIWQTSHPLRLVFARREAHNFAVRGTAPALQPRLGRGLRMQRRRRLQDGVVLGRKGGERGEGPCACARRRCCALLLVSSPRGSAVSAAAQELGARLDTAAQHAAQAVTRKSGRAPQRLFVLVLEPAAVRRRSKSASCLARLPDGSSRLRELRRPLSRRTGAVLPARLVCVAACCGTGLPPRRRRACVLQQPQCALHRPARRTAARRRLLASAVAACRLVLERRGSRFSHVSHMSPQPSRSRLVGQARQMLHLSPRHGAETPPARTSAWPPLEPLELRNTHTYKQPNLRSALERGLVLGGP